MKYPKVCIIILNWNGKELLKDCLSSLFKLTDYPNYKVIVVDNGSTDGSVEFVKKHFPKADVLALDKNYGFSKGNNKGIKYALKKYKPKYILLLNNDTEIIQRDWLTKMVEVAESDEKIGIVGCKLIYPDGKPQKLHGCLKIVRIIPPSYNKVEKADYVSGACMLIKSDVIKKIGLFDEGFYPAYFEDIDFCLRAKNSEYESVITPEAMIIHHTAKTSHKLNENYFFYIGQKNKIRFILLNYPFRWLFLRFFWEIGVFFKALINKKSRLLLKAYLENFKNLREILLKRKNRKAKVKTNLKQEFRKNSRFIDSFKSIFFKYIYLLTNGDVRAKLNFLYFLIFLLPYFLIKKIFKVEIKPITMTAPFNFVLNTYYGKFLCRGKKGDIGIINPYYERKIQKYFLQHKNFGIFVDVGAHIGRYSIMMASLNRKGKVIAIEPDPDNLNALRVNIKINRLKNVKVLPVAVGSKNGLIRLFYDKWKTTSPSTTPYLKTKRYILVKCRKLDSLLSNTKRIDLMKIDIEGAELEALKGAKNTLKRTKAIIFESFEDRIDKVREFLEKNNFQVFNTLEKNYYYAINTKIK